MKGLDRPIEAKVRNAVEMREFMQSMGLSEAIIKRAIKVKYNLPGPEPEPSPRPRKGRKAARLSGTT